MAESPNTRTGADPRPPMKSPLMRRLRYWTVGAAAVFSVYVGGFLWDEVSPAAYSAVFVLVGSVPLLLKSTFWKKLIMLFPLLIIRVLGKILIQLFGSRALETVFRRYGLLERRYKNTLKSVQAARVGLTQRWQNLSRRAQAHLLLAFLPFLIVIAILVLVIRLLRTKVLQMLVEKVLQKTVQHKVHTGVEKAAGKIKHSPLGKRVLKTLDKDNSEIK